MFRCDSIAFVMNIAARLHQIFLPRSYSSILDFRYSGDVARTIRSSSIRLIYVALISIGFYVLGLSAKEIYLGVFISAFLNVWPAVVQYKLIAFAASPDKLKLLLGYAAFVIFSVAFSYLSINYIYRSFAGDRVFGVVESKGVDILVSLMAAAGLCSVETVIGKFAHVKKHMDIESFRVDKELLLDRVYLEEIRIDEYCYEIQNASDKYGISDNLLKYLLVLEYIYRGQWYIRLIERVICRFSIFYSFAIRKDLSMGLAQIKISTAKELLKCNPRSFIPKMCDPAFSIDLCAAYISKMLEDYDQNEITENVYDYIASEYLSGLNDRDSEIVRLYSVILEHFDGGKE